MSGLHGSTTRIGGPGAPEGETSARLWIRGADGALWDEMEAFTIDQTAEPQGEGGGAALSGD